MSWKQLRVLVRTTLEISSKCQAERKPRAMFRGEVRVQELVAEKHAVAERGAPSFLGFTGCEYRVWC